MENKKRLIEITNIIRKRDIIHGMTPEKLLLILEDLGPTYVKLGQILSMRSDILPAEYCEELTKLRSNVEPMSYADVCDVINQSCKRSIDELFDSFSREPLGSASIAQVHFAQLMNEKTPVVVKVQRKNIYEKMMMDISLLKKAVRVIEISPSNINDVIDMNIILDELWSVAQEELDFLKEAKNAKEFAALNDKIKYVECPVIIDEITTSKVLVMEYIDGYSIDDAENLKKDGYDLNEIGAKLAENYVKQIIDDGFFHADPHQGNIKIRDGKIAWMDMGMMGRLSARDQKLFGKAIEAVAKNDIGTIKDVILTIGVFKSKIDHNSLYNDIDLMLSKYGTMDMKSLDISSIMDEFLLIAKKHNGSMPSGVFMLGRGVAVIQGVLLEISPEINFVEIISNHMKSDILTNFDFKKEIGKNAKIVLDSGNEALRIPIQISNVLKSLQKGQTKLDVELTPSEGLKKYGIKLVNNLILGILIASLLVASSLICTTDMGFRLLDIPVLGLLGYFVAFVLCVWLIYDTIKSRK